MKDTTDICTYIMKSIDYNITQAAASANSPATYAPCPLYPATDPDVPVIGTDPVEFVVPFELAAGTAPPVLCAAPGAAGLAVVLVMFD